MSYDLYFRSPEPNTPLSYDEFSSFFDGRRFYTQRDRQSSYFNKHTGVYFEFTYGEPPFNAACWDMESKVNWQPIAFNLNYFRPHIFGLEAEIEVSAFTHHFKFFVSDPQTHGMGDGPYSRAGFLRGFNAGNEVACRVLLEELGKKAECFPMATSTLESVWQWNYEADEFNNQLGDRFFVPHIMVLQQGSLLKTAIVWTDAMPIALPEVDVIILFRDKTAPRHWLQKRSDKVFIAWDQAVADLREFPRKDGPLSYRFLDYETEPPALRRLFECAKQNQANRFELIPFDKIINTEYVARADTH